MTMTTTMSNRCCLRREQSRNFPSRSRSNFTLSPLRSSSENAISLCLWILVVSLRITDLPKSNQGRKNNKREWKDTSFVTMKHETTALRSANVIWSETSSPKGERRSRYCVFPPLVTFDFAVTARYAHIIPGKAEPYERREAASVPFLLVQQGGFADLRTNERASARMSRFKQSDVTPLPSCDRERQPSIVP